MDGLFTNEKFAILLGLLEKSKLKDFCIEWIESHETIQALVESTSKMQVAALQFDPNEGLTHLKPDLIRAVKQRAVKQNASLQVCVLFLAIQRQTTVMMKTSSTWSTRAG